MGEAGGQRTKASPAGAFPGSCTHRTGGMRDGRDPGDPVCPAGG